MVKFTENFWGEKCLGYDVLYHNMKFGQKSCNDFIEFVKERTVIEENYSKQLTKLSRQVGSSPPLGSFAPYFHILKQSTEKSAGLHQQMVIKLQDLLKEMQKYLDEQTRKHKTMKDAEVETSNVVQSIQTLSTSLHKAKEAYLARSQELEKCRKDNAGPRDVERAETRVKKASEDYRAQVDKYSTTRLDFERKMLNTSQHFQDLEEQHLQQMLEFANGYGKVIHYCWQTIGEVYNELKSQTAEMSIERLLSLFIEPKSTGTEKPAPTEFEEAVSQTNSVASLPVAAPATDNLLDFGGDFFSTPQPSAFPITGATQPALIVDTENATAPATAAPAPLAEKRGGILRWPSEPEQPLPQKSKSRLHWHKARRKAVQQQASKSASNLPSNEPSNLPANEMLESRITHSESVESHLVNGMVGDAKRGVFEWPTGRRWAGSSVEENGIATKENGKVSSGGTLSESKRKFPSLRNLFTTSKSYEEPRSTSSHHSTTSAPSPTSPDLPSDQKSQTDPAAQLNRSTVRGSKWFLRVRTKDRNAKEKESKKDKDTKKDSKKKKSKDGSGSSGRDTSTPTIAEDAKSESSFGSQSNPGNVSAGVEVDAEGYSVKPNEADSRKPRSDSFEQFHQESSESESEEDEPKKKFNVVIKPATIQANHTGPTGDELRKQAQALQIGNLGFSYTGGRRATNKMQDMMKRSTSVSNNMLDQKKTPMFAPFPSQVDSGVLGQGAYPIPPQRTGGSMTSNPWDSTPDFSTLNQTTPLSFVSPLNSDHVPSLPTRKISSGSSSSDAPPLPPSILPRPLTLPSATTTPIPFAVAFVEKISAVFIGADESRCRTKIEGDLHLAFPSAVLQTLLANPNHPSLRFCLAQTGHLENVLPNKHLVSQETQIDDGRITYTFNMGALVSQMKVQLEAKAAPQPHVNIHVMKYYVSSNSGASSAPVLLVSYWKDDEQTTDMRLDYRRHPACPPLRGCQFTVPVNSDVQVTSMTSVPHGEWSSGNPQGARWNVMDPSTELANIKARFEHPAASKGRVKGPVQCSFQAEGVTLSKVLFQLVSPGYNVTMIKMKTASARYVCEVDDASKR